MTRIIKKSTTARTMLAISIIAVTTGCKDIDYEMAARDASTGDVYFAGEQSGGGDTTRFATYWKNGTAVRLSDGKNSAWLTGIAISGSDVHAVGTDGASLAYWKNGTKVDLGDSLKFPRAICVSGNDVYVLAESQTINRHVLIKNNVPTGIVFPNKPAYASYYCRAMAVSGEDVYLAGFGGDVHQPPMLWKNGVSLISTHLDDGFFSDIVVEKNGVYASATLTDAYGQGKKAAYWNNGSLVILTDGTKPAGATAIFVSGNDVYVAGWEANTNGVSQAKYWKNGVPTLLPSDVACKATGIGVSGSDVYVSGASSTVYGAMLWKNGTIVPPFTGNDSHLNDFSFLEVD